MVWSCFSAAFLVALLGLVNSDTTISESQEQRSVGITGSQDEDSMESSLELVQDIRFEHPTFDQPVEIVEAFPRLVPLERGTTLTLPDFRRACFIRSTIAAVRFCSGHPARRLLFAPSLPRPSSL